MNYHDQKIRRTLTHDIRKHRTAVFTLIGLISSVYRDLHNWRSNQRKFIKFRVFFKVLFCRILGSIFFQLNFLGRTETLQLSLQPISHTSDAKINKLILMISIRLIIKIGKERISNTFSFLQKQHNFQRLYIYILYHHHHHHTPLARTSLTLSCHFSLSFIVSGWSSGLHPVSSHNC